MRESSTYIRKVTAHSVFFMNLAHPFSIRFGKFKHVYEFGFLDAYTMLRTFANPIHNRVNTDINPRYDN